MGKFILVAVLMIGSYVAGTRHTDIAANAKEQASRVSVTRTGNSATVSVR